MLFILQTLIAWRKTILIAAILTAGAMAGISFLLPKWYTASSSVFPPRPKSMMPSLADVVQNLQLPILGPASMGKNPYTIYIDVLKSRRVREQIIKEFGLMEVYDVDSMEKALRELNDHTGVTVIENGLLTVSYEDQDRERAADVTNRYVELLDQYNQEANTTRAAKTRQFIAGQIEQRAQTLAEAEGDLKSFQQAHQALELDEQVHATIDVVTGLTADAIALEVELEILEQYTSTNSQEYQRKQKEYEELLVQLQKFKIRSTRSEDDFVRSFFPTFDELPEVALELARLMRKVKIEETVYELLIKEYEMARIEEARDTPTVQVLDAASVPELRSRPRRKMLTVIGGVVGAGWSALLAIFVGVWRDETGRGRSFRSALEPVARDLRRVFRRG
jgi:tyrosine-protein kinase Etk/Wzc